MARGRDGAADVLGVLKQTWAATRAGLAEIPTESYAFPSTLEGWTVGDLIAHVGRAMGAVSAARPASGRVEPLTVAAYLATYPGVAEEIAAATRDDAAEQAADPLGALDAEWSAASVNCAGLLAPGSPDPVLIARRGPILMSDFLRTRVLELVVHMDDLDRSLSTSAGAGLAVGLPTDAVRLTVRMLLDSLVATAPGRSVEVRVPPYAAVQCIEGPRHTRGTPPDVVECDAWTWVRLGCGRVTWPEALTDGTARASGERADLSSYLPLL